MKECCICKKEIEEEKEICDECKEKELLKWKKRNKVLTVIQIIFVFVIIAIAIIIYQENNCDNNRESSSTQWMKVIEAFNSEWSNYEGTIMGTQVKSMITQMIGHSNTYQEEPEKVIGVEYIDKNGIVEQIEYFNEEQIEEFIQKLNNLYTKIERELKYKVEFDYEGMPIIKTIKITAGGKI